MRVLASPSDESIRRLRNEVTVSQRAFVEAEAARADDFFHFVFDLLEGNRDNDE